ncbi:hypothetical protein [Bradyrhizobium sp.]|nr:hypothetical protein [Bradyrhizobium sp.]
MGGSGEIRRRDFVQTSGLLAANLIVGRSLSALPKAEAATDSSA